MASTSTIKTNCYNFLNGNLRNIIDNKCERNPNTSSVSFDEFAEARGRSTRAASLALPNNSLLDLFEKEQNLLNPVNLKPTLTTSIKNTISSTVSSLNKLRRHSTSASVEQDDDQCESGMANHQNAVFFTGAGGGDAIDATGVLPLSNENLKLHQRLSGKRSRSIKSSVSSTGSNSGSNNAPPPVPKRTFQTSRTNGSRGAATPTITQTRQKSYSVDQRDSASTPNGMVNGNCSSEGRKLSEKFSSLSSMSGREDDLDDDRMSVESSVFEDTPPYSSALMTRQQLSCDDNSSPILNKKMLSSSNRSSSDSNKSQITIDTGYMSSTTSTASAITNNTESATNERTTPVTTTNGGTFRSRFSSEDTQSSLDSFMSSGEQQQTHNPQRYVVPTDYASSYGQTNPSPSYLQTGGTSSYYLATAGTNDVIEYLQKYSARNYPNNVRTANTSKSSAAATSANTGVGRSRNQQVHKSQHNQTISARSSSMGGGGGGSSSSTISADSATTTATSTISMPTAVVVGRGAAAVGHTKDEVGASNSTSSANSMTSLSSTSMMSGNNSSSHSNNNNNNKQAPQQQQQQAATSLLKITPPPSSAPSSASPSTSSSSSVSLSGTGLTTITATTTISTATQPRNSTSGLAGVFGQKSSNSRGSSSSSGGGLSSIAVPLRSQVSFDSAKIIQTGQILGAKITQHFTSNKQPPAVELTKDKGGGVVPGGVNTTIPQSGGAVNPPRRGLSGILNKPPPLTQIHHTKMNQRQDSNISSDSFSITSSPGYNSKSMEAPLLQHTAKIHRSAGAMKHQDSSDSFNMTMRGPSTTTTSVGGSNRKFNVRQDSTISSDSFSQTSSPGYNSKLMEAPLLAHAAKMHKIKHGYTERLPRSPLTTEHHPTSPIIKSASTPASLQTIVRFQNGSNMSLQHKIVNKRKDSNPYITRGRLKFRLCQILINAVALLAIAGGLAAYFNAYPRVKYLNKTIILAPTTETPPLLSHTSSSGMISSGVGNGDMNPAPGVCLPIIVKFCQQQNVPYNFTVYPNYIGNFGQIEADADLDNYDALVDVRCYELVGLFLCSLFVPRCGVSGNSVPPCRSLCFETMRRCGFFFDVFNLELPDYLKCNLFSESIDPDECVGHYEVIEAKKREKNPTCSGFLCDQRRCIPNDWRCDGHVDCLDQTDEFECDMCGNGTIYCGGTRCMSQKHVCDGVPDCPFGQDERNCIRLSERNGDTGKGILEVYKADQKQWAPACVNNWDGTTSPSAVCSMLGYSAVNGSWIKLPNPNFSNFTMVVPEKDTTSMWQMIQKKKTNLMKEFISCPPNDYHAVAELSCSNFECGKVRRRKLVARTRIVGGSESKPGDWPFIAAILGGPEEIFYCAGVLISDQFVLTAAHCVGNTTHRNLNEWTIQLGMTRRHSHTYYGQKVKVARVIPHPQYSANHDNDIAMFQLATRVAFHEHLLPVCLPPALKEIKPGTKCTVIGWGKREDKNANPDNVNLTYEPAVNEVEVPILHRDLCNEWLDTLNVTEGMMCAGFREGGKDACQGDSGGPLLCRDPNDRDRWFVGGIVSWGVMCAHPKLPGVYANVPRYIPWINQQIYKYTMAPTNGL